LSETYTATGTNPDHLRAQSLIFNNSTLNAYTTYNLNLHVDHAFKFMLGVNRVTSTTEWQSSQINSLTDYFQSPFNFGNGTQLVAGDKAWEAQLGYFGRVNYAYKNKYCWKEIYV
jgi:hypothetical protein